MLVQIVDNTLSKFDENINPSLNSVGLKLLLLSIAASIITSCIFLNDIVNFLQFLIYSLAKADGLSKFEINSFGKTFIVLIASVLLCLTLSLLFKYLKGAFRPYLLSFLGQFFGERKFVDELRHIKEGIQYEVNRGSNFALSSPIKLFSKKSKIKPISSAKEIEEEIIKALEHRRNKNIAPIIYVLDELDKIELHENSLIVEKELEENLDSGSEILSHRMRLRQDRLFNILGNLKYFFTQAQSKFIFVTGRPMYDAWLAGIADRNNFLNSIFNQMIYVDSFYRSSKKYKDDIFKLTELFLVSALSEYDSKLDSIESYLKTVEVEPKEKEKIKYFLFQFVFYLAYRSNGVPQKMNTLLLNYIEACDRIPEKKKRGEKVIFVYKQGANILHYLRFDFFRQYKVCFAAGVFKSFVLSKSSFLKLYEDKMIVSTGFLLDHLFKFHEHGFSFRALELTPEIISVNKAPELRRFIQSMVSFLEENHIKRIDNGLFEFKFLHLTHLEISYISKISENNAAAYNFTLDESLPIKRHYYKKLSQLEKKKAGGKFKNQTRSEMGFISRILGDLHFYDKEYDEAVINYSLAYQEMTNQSRKKLALNFKKETSGRFDQLNQSKQGLTGSFQKFQSYSDSNSEDLFDLTGQVRYRMKLALTYERTRSYDAAQLIYRELINEVRKIVTVPGIRKAIKGQYVLLQPFIAYLYVSEKIPFQDTNSEIALIRTELYTLITGEKFTEDFLDKMPKQDFKQFALFVNRIGDLFFFRNGNSFMFPRTFGKNRGDSQLPYDAFEFYKSALSNCSIINSTFVLKKNE